MSYFLVKGILIFLDLILAQQVVTLELKLQVLVFKLTIQVLLEISINRF